KGENHIHRLSRDRRFSRGGFLGRGCFGSGRGRGRLLILGADQLGHRQRENRGAAQKAGNEVGFRAHWAFLKAEVFLNFSVSRRIFRTSSASALRFISRSTSEERSRPSAAISG